MPDPQAFEARTAALWPPELPGPQAGLRMISPARAALTDVLSGPTRLNVTARTAPAEWLFELWLTRAQMESFEAWYQQAVLASDGEFYARWIGGSRIVAFAAPYEYRALGSGWALAGRVIRTRIDPAVCDAYINAVFGAILRDDGKTANAVLDDGSAVDVIKDDYPLEMIADHGC